MIKSLGGDLKKLFIILSLLLSLSLAQDYSLSFDGVDDYVVADYSQTIDDLFESFVPASTFFHNDWTISIKISIDLEELGFGTDSFEGAQIFSKGYSPEDPCGNPSEVQLFLEPGSSEHLSFVVYQEQGSSNFYRIQVNGFEAFPTDSFVEIVATFKDADEATVESNLTFDGSTLTVTGDVSASSNISGSAFYGDGSNLSNLPAGSPSAPVNSVQFNEASSFGGDAQFTWNTTTQFLAITGT